MSSLVPLVGEVWVCECLGEALNEDEEGYSGEDDKSEERCA